MAKDPYKYFRIEARELLGQLNQAALAVEKGDQAGDHLKKLLRLAHTLKGAARIVKRPEIAERAHAMEDALNPHRDGAAPVPREVVDLVMRLADEIDRHVQGLPNSSPASETEPTAARAAAESQTKEAPRTGANEPVRLVRAETEDLDVLLDGIAEAHATVGALGTSSRDLEQIHHLASLLEEQLAPRGPAELQRTGSAERDRVVEAAQELRKRLGDIASRVDTALEQINRELGQLREAVEQMRLVAAGSYFVTLERAARDIARELKKDVDFEGKGGDIRLDAQVMSVVQPALVQIIRNAVAHGIETADERAAVGKPGAGRIALSVSRRGRQIVFRCQDDGRGVDLEAVRRAATRRGLLGAGETARNAQELMRILMRGGISTARTVTEVAGRGIGLDIVSESIARLGGDVAVQTEAGKGTVFELVVPLSVASLDALTVEAAGNTLSIPLDAVRTVSHLKGTDIAWAADGATTLYEGQAIPFVSLPQALYGAKPSAAQGWPIVIVSSGEKYAAVGVERLIGTARVVVRPLAKIDAVNDIVAGASLDSEGNPQLALDSDELVGLARRGVTAELRPDSQGLPILIVDDSLTTRMLEQSILEAAGYRVDTASSAEDGLEQMQQNRYALVLCDVEMPGMDGFMLVEKARAHPSLHDVPIILVTSRAAPEDLQRGKDVRADGYVIKSEFDQTELLAMIRGLTVRQ